MGYKSYAQQKAVWADRKDGGKGHPDKKKGSPAKAHGGSHLGEGHDIKKRMQFDPANRKRVQAMPQKTKDSLQGEAWEYGGPFYSPKFQVNVDPEDGVLSNRPIYSDGTMLTYPSLSKPTSRQTELNAPPPNPPKKKSEMVEGVDYQHFGNKKGPLNHCASDMMHSGGWQEMRKHNSPGTTGNKEGIKHNEKMREDIGTFKMPHSPLNKNNEVDKDSIATSKAWKDFKEGYMSRTKHPATGKPIDSTYNKNEYDREKHEFYFDKNKKKMKLIPTDDGEQRILDGIDKSQLAPDRKSSNDKISPLNKEGKKDACYHKVKSRVKVWPSAYASGQLVQCRKAGAANWGEKSKKK
jgi:hypothetical protein